MKISVINSGCISTFIQACSIYSPFANKIAPIILSLLVRGWLVLIIMGLYGHVEGQRLLWMGEFYGYYTRANDVSADGRYVVGFAYLSTSTTTGIPFLWDTHTGDKIILRGLGGAGGEARGISADGRFVTGWANNANGNQHAFLWDTQNGQVQDLDTLSNSISEGWDISADGSIVVGYFVDPNIRYERAFLWNTQTGEMRNLGTLGGTNSNAYGVSSNGQFVVGWSRTATSRIHAFLYNVASYELQDLDLVDSLVKGHANSVSNSGALAVGSVDTSFGRGIATVWEYSSKTYLESLGEQMSEALDFTDDGGVIVGYSFTPARERRAVIWGTSTIGALDLNVLYDSLLNGSVLVEARAVSPDGRFIVGYGYNAQTERNEAFLLDREGVTGIEQPTIVPKNVQLYQNYPNPFNPATKIVFTLPKSMEVDLVICNVQGQRVKRLFQGKLASGSHTVIWDGTNNAGLPVSSGVYLYRLQAGNNIAVRKMLLVR